VGNDVGAHHEHAGAFVGGRRYGESSSESPATSPTSRAREHAAARRCSRSSHRPQNPGHPRKRDSHDLRLLPRQRRRQLAPSRPRSRRCRWSQRAHATKSRTNAQSRRARLLRVAVNRVDRISHASREPRMGRSWTSVPIRRRRLGPEAACGAGLGVADFLPAEQALRRSSTSVTLNRSRARGPSPNRRAPSSAACSYTQLGLTLRYSASSRTPTSGSSARIVFAGSNDVMRRPRVTRPLALSARGSPPLARARIAPRMRSRRVRALGRAMRATRSVGVRSSRDGRASALV
jgi:hypothetical protein